MRSIGSRSRPRIFTSSSASWRRRPTVSTAKRCSSFDVLQRSSGGPSSHVAKTTESRIGGS
jgi:hypothetical protein